MNVTPPWTKKHLQWLEETGEVITTKCGKQAKVFTFTCDIENEEVMSAWAKHLRNHYCSDSQIEFLKAPGQSNKDYLLTMKFPSASVAPGPSIRAGDFAEILVADYLTFLCGFCVPRTRYDRKGVPNESTKGSDVLAFKQDPENPRKDELLVYEVKAKLSPGHKSMLQVAIDDSKKDEFRIPESLNGIKQRMLDRQDMPGVALVSRFQDSVASPYKRKFGAAAVCTDLAYDTTVMSDADTEEHPNKESLELIAIKGQNLMDLAHKLYERAANEI
ncbi:Hachiman antiphage defense system protein HamA [Vibrio fortis]|uniref:Hachiman antiphage defense system protein HamA n=1 Tax=Vibrio fortis TaxID=212667 RepID=UPI0038CD28BB